MKAPQASNNAALLVSRMTTISLRLKETSRRKRMLLFLVRMLALDDLCQAQQFRAELQSGALGGVQIDFEFHPVSVVEEVDDAAFARENRGLPHRHDARVSERFQNHRKIFLLRRTDEKNVAGLQFSELFRLAESQVFLPAAGRFRAAELQRPLESLDLQLPAVHEFVLQLFQLRAEGVLAHDADDDGRCGVLERSRRPLDELDEVEQITRLRFVLRGRGCGNAGQPGEKARQGQQGQNDSIHNDESHSWSDLSRRTGNLWTAGGVCR